MNRTTVDEHTQEVTSTNLFLPRNGKERKMSRQDNLVCCCSEAKLFPEFVERCNINFQEFMHAFRITDSKVQCNALTDDDDSSQ